MNGLQKPGRREFICDETVDFMALTETHANHYMQSTLPHELHEHACIWGCPMENRRFAGVAFLYKKSSVWAVQKVPFVNKTCEAYYRDGRLLCVQIFRSMQRRSFILYILYGKSGGRWEADKRRYNCNLIQAVHEDSVMRGSMATVMCGDFNMTVQDVSDAFAKLKRDRWCDSALYGMHGFDDQPTSLQGKGARIDLAFFNESATSLIHSYNLRDGVPGARHMVLDLSFKDLLASQVTYTQKTVACRGKFQKPPPNYEPPLISVGLEMRALLSQNNTEDALTLWNNRAESFLKMIPTEGGSFVSGRGRGKVGVRRVCVCSPT